MEQEILEKGKFHVYVIDLSERSYAIIYALYVLTNCPFMFWCSQAVIFVDNSGADIILGILPFARELLRRGTQVCSQILFLLLNGSYGGNPRSFLASFLFLRKLYMYSLVCISKVKLTLCQLNQAWNEYSEFWCLFVFQISFNCFHARFLNELPC